MEFFRARHLIGAVFFGAVPALMWVFCSAGFVFAQTGAETAGASAESAPAESAPATPAPTESAPAAPTPTEPVPAVDSEEAKTAVAIPKPDQPEESPAPGEAAAPATAEPAPLAAPAPTPAGPEAEKDAADHTITLTKVVEVYEFEDLKVAVDQYQVNRGDSLVRILKQRGLLITAQDEAKYIRLVKTLNPDLKDVNNLTVGQLLNLPGPPKTGEDPAGTAETTPAAAPETAPAEAAAPTSATPGPVTVTETVKTYERPQSTQKPARVEVRRHLPGDSQSAGSPEGPAPAETTTAQPTPGGLDFPSGNAGPLAVAPESQVVYRTVKVRRGDSLERLLRREGLHKDLIYSHLLKVTMELNPQIKDPNLILAGAELRIPAAGDYLTAMAGVDPGQVRAAAQAIAERRRPIGGGVGGGSGRAGGSESRAAVLELPDERMLTARNTLGLLFSRLGERVDSRGQVVIPDPQGAVELDTAAFPLIMLSNGKRVVLDMGSRLPRAAVRSLKGLTPPHEVFRTGKNENLDQALGRLWPLCGYFRVYGRDRTYEGGGDIRLKIAADWMVWPTEEAWNSGQPLVVNRVRSAERRTDPAWAVFLEDHGIKVLDVYRSTLLAAPEKSAETAELAVTVLNTQNPTFFAAELIKALGVEPRVGVQLDLAHTPGQAPPGNITAPVLWETGEARVVLDFGELPPDVVLTLRQNGYRLVSTRPNNEAIVEAVLAGFGLKAQNSLVLNAPAGGPKMSLSINGRVVSTGGQKYLITAVALPSGLAQLMEPGLKVLKY